VARRSRTSTSSCTYLPPFVGCTAAAGRRQTILSAARLQRGKTISALTARPFPFDLQALDVCSSYSAAPCRCSCRLRVVGHTHPRADRRPRRDLPTRDPLYIAGVGRAADGGDTILRRVPASKAPRISYFIFPARCLRQAVSLG